jgi:pyrophosphatase PpaX
MAGFEHMPREAVRSRGGAPYVNFLFDLDGTLLDTTSLIIASFQHALRVVLGREVTVAEITSRLGEPLPTTMERFCRERRDELVECYRTFNIENHDRLARAFPGVPETLAALKGRGMRLAVVSAKMRSTVHKGLALARISDLFDAVVGLEDTEKHKPDPAPLVEALRRLAAAPATAVMVGDSPYDLLAARAAGVASVAVSWSSYSREELDRHQPDFTISAMNELLALAGEVSGQRQHVEQLD